MLWQMEYGARTSDHWKHWHEYHYYYFSLLLEDYFKRSDMVEQIMERLLSLMDNVAKKVDLKIPVNQTPQDLAEVIDVLYGIGHPSCVNASRLLWNEGSYVWQKGYKEFTRWVENRTSIAGNVVVGMLLRFGSPEEQGTISSWIRETDNKKAALDVIAQCTNVSFIEMFAREPYMNVTDSIQLPDGLVSTAYRKAAFRVAMSMPEAVRRNKGSTFSIPITFLGASKLPDRFAPTKKKVHWMTTEEATIEDSSDENTAVIVNPGFAGLYFVNYDARNWALIWRHLFTKEIDTVTAWMLCDQSEKLFKENKTTMETMLWQMEYGARTSDVKHWHAYHSDLFSLLLDTYFKRSDMAEQIMERLLSVMDNVAKKMDFKPVANDVTYAQVNTANILCGIGHPSCVNASTLLWNEGSSVWKKGYEEFNQWVENRFTLAGKDVMGMLLRFGSPEEQGTILSWVRETENKKVALEVIAHSTDVSLIEMFARENFMSVTDSIRLPGPLVSIAYRKAAFRVVMSMPEAVRRNKWWVENRFTLAGKDVMGMLLRFGSPEEQGTILSWVRETENKKVALEVIAHSTDVSLIEMFARENFMSVTDSIRLPGPLVSIAYRKAAFRVVMSMPEAVRRNKWKIFGFDFCSPSEVIYSQEDLNLYIAKLPSLNCDEGSVDEGLTDVRVILANLKRGRPGLLRWLKGELPPAVP
ncbi:uncharacterized protein ISCGN_018353 [Ixodes scapularis]